jgi:hypothetical protein
LDFEPIKFKKYKFTKKVPSSNKLTDEEEFFNDEEKSNTSTPLKYSCSPVNRK